MGKKEEVQSADHPKNSIDGFSKPAHGRSGVDGKNRGKWAEITGNKVMMLIIVSTKNEIEEKTKEKIISYCFFFSFFFIKSQHLQI